jgi:hypothetical protein
MKEPIGNSGGSQPLEANDTRFDVDLVEAVAAVLVKHGYRRPSDPLGQERAYVDCVLVLSILCSVFEGRAEHSGLMELMRQFGQPSTPALSTALELQRLAKHADRQRLEVQLYEDALAAQERSMDEWT